MSVQKSSSNKAKGNNGANNTDSKNDTPANAIKQAEPKIVQRNLPPLAEGKRSGGRRSGNGSTFNFGTAAYNDVREYVSAIVNGLYRPTFNGAAGMDVNKEAKVYKTAEEAFADGAVIGFGLVEGPKSIGYVQNNKLEENLQTGSGKQYDCFLTAANKEDAAVAIQRIKEFYAMPWNAKVKPMVKFLYQGAEGIEAIPCTAETELKHVLIPTYGEQTLKTTVME